MGLIIALVAEARVERREDLPSSSSCRTLMLNTTPPITCTMTPMRDQIVGMYMQFGFTELTVCKPRCQFKVAMFAMAAMTAAYSSRTNNHRHAPLVGLTC